MAFAVSDFADCTFEVIVPVFILFLLLLRLAGHSRYMEKFTIKYSSFSFSTTARSGFLAYISGRVSAKFHNVFVFIFSMTFSAPL